MEGGIASIGPWCLGLGHSRTRADRNVRPTIELGEGPLRSPLWRGSFLPLSCSPPSSLAACNARGGGRPIRQANIANRGFTIAARSVLRVLRERGEQEIGDQETAESGFERR